MIKVNIYNAKWKKKITQKEFIEATKLCKATVSKLYSGKPYDFQLSTLDKVCEFLDCSIHDILIEERNK